MVYYQRFDVTLVLPRAGCPCRERRRRRGFVARRRVRRWRWFCAGWIFVEHSKGWMGAPGDSAAGEGRHRGDGSGVVALSEDVANVERCCRAGWLAPARVPGREHFKPWFGFHKFFFLTQRARECPWYERVGMLRPTLSTARQARRYAPRLSMLPLSIVGCEIPRASTSRMFGAFTACES